MDPEHPVICILLCRCLACPIAVLNGELRLAYSAQLHKRDEGSWSRAGAVYLVEEGFAVDEIGIAAIRQAIL